MTGRPRFFLALAMLLFCATPAFALEIQISASRSDVSVGEQFTVGVEVSGSGMGRPPQPSLPPVDGVRQISSYSSQNFSFVNGRATSSVTIQYVMVADREGTFSFGPATVEADGERLESAQVTVKVTPAGSTATAPRRFGDDELVGEESKDLIVLAKVDNETPYVNEQIVYTFTFLRRPQTQLLEGSRYTQPSMVGFWTEELDTTDPTEVVIEGRRYVAERIRTALFPTGHGTFTIEPAKLNVSVEDRTSARRRDPFDVFGTDRFGLRRRGRQLSMQTKPITINVKPLPAAGKPAKFSGAVGKFTLAATVDRTSLKAGEPVTLEVTLAGQGNVKVVPAPELEVGEDFKIYESESKESNGVRGDRIVGSKVWEYVLVPTTGGEVELPPVRLSVFDPETAEYVMLATDPIRLDVEATELDEALARGDDLGVAKERVRLRQRDIRYVKPAPGSLRRADGAFAGRGFVLAHIVPVLAFAGSAVYRRRRDRLRTDVRYARNKRAAKVASKRLAEARSALRAQQLEEFFAQLATGLRGFVADKLHLAAANLDPVAVRHGFSSAGVAGEQIEELFAILESCDSARFSPLGSDPLGAQLVLDRAERWIRQVDQ